MEEDEIKPDDTDSSEENLLGDLFDEGESNDESTKVALTMEDLEKVAGRKFTSKEDFEKHYTNLKSFVGKANQSEKKPVETQKDSSVDAVLAEMKELKAQVAERDFILDNPQAKSSLSLVRKVAKADGISLLEAWEQVKDLATSAEEYKKGRDIGVNSKTRINPVVSEKNKEVIHQAKLGSPEAGDTLVKAHLKAIGLE